MTASQGGIGTDVSRSPEFRQADHRQTHSYRSAVAAGIEAARQAG